MIRVLDLSVSVAGRLLLDQASFVVAAGEKSAVVGRNGAGKTSLVSVLVGEPSAQLAHHGEVQVAGSVGYLPQVPVQGGLGTDPSAFSHVLSARGLDALDEALTDARRAMAADPTASHIERFSETEERYCALGGYGAESEVARMAEGLGFPEELLFEHVDRLSGGQRRRLDLMRALFGGPDVLILDEPTNHLDLSAKRWLMDQLDRFRGALLLVSHDVRLLDRSITKVLHLDRSTIAEYKGSYSAFRQQLAQRAESQQRIAQRQEREIQRLSSLADSMRASSAKRARVAKRLDTRVDRLERTRVHAPRKERVARFRLPDPPRSGETPLDVRALAVSYGPLSVLRSVSMSLGRGERAMVVGRNGAGKSSLLRCLAGVQSPTAGAVTVGHAVTVGYFAQEHEQLDPDKSAIDHVDDSVLETELDRRTLLGSFGIPGEIAMRKVSSLSGGERAKLSLAVLAAGWSNLLLLDEPTNNLDPASRLSVGEMLGAWPGTLVVVSHDREFVEALEPTHALVLPSERYDLWRDELLDQVELR